MDIEFINKNLEKNKYAMFIRKVAPEFPEDILKHYIYERYREKDKQLVIREPLLMIWFRFKFYLWFFFCYGFPLFFIIYGLKYFL